jgi:hypothetical protein
VSRAETRTTYDRMCLFGKVESALSARFKDGGLVIGLSEICEDAVDMTHVLNERRTF